MPPEPAALVLRLRDTSASGDPELDWLLTMLDCEIALRAGDTERARMTIDAGRRRAPARPGREPARC